MKTPSQIMSEARFALKGKWDNLVLASFVYFVIINAASITYFGQLIIYGSMLMGLYTVLYNNYENRKFEFNTLFSGFQNFVNTFLLGLLTSILIALWSLLLIVPGIIASIRYSMAFFIMKENPTMDAMSAINASSKMMAGHKMEYFKLCLSFIGWFILSVISCGIGFFFLIPYFYTAKIIFYEDLKKQQVPPTI